MDHLIIGGGAVTKVYIEKKSHEHGFEDYLLENKNNNSEPTDIKKLFRHLVRAHVWDTMKLMKSRDV